jgi:transposase
MAKRDNNRIVAETMFIEQGMTCKAIAELIDVSEKTLSKWRNDGQWDQKREESLAAPHRIRLLLLNELKTVAEGGESKIDADALAKISKVMESISGNVSPQIVITVLKELDNWMATQDPAIAVTFLDFHRRFIQHVIAQHNV